MKMPEVIAELTKRGIKFDEKASYNDLYAILRNARDAEDEAAEAEKLRLAKEEAAKNGGEDNADDEDDGEMVKAVILGNVKHDGVFYPKNQCATLSKETFELFKLKGLV